MSSNVHHLPSSSTAVALTLARAMPPSHLDRILEDVAANLRPETAADALDRLVTAGEAVQAADGHWPGGVMRGLLNRLTAVTAERDQARRVAVSLEQQIGEIDQLADKWSGWHGLPGGIGRNLLDITRSQRGDDPTTA